MREFSVFDKFKEQVVVIDNNYRILYANEAYIKENGYSSKEEVVGKPCHLISHKRETPCDGECHPCPLKEIENTGSSVSVVHTHYTHDNKETPVEIFAFPIDNGEKIIQIVRNIKHDREKYYLFSLSQKLSSIGFLALGIAHQLNTPLATIQLAIEEIEKKFGPSEETEIIKNSVKTCKGIVEKLLLFSGKGDKQDFVDIAKTVEDVIELLKVYANDKGVIIEKDIQKLYILGSESDIRHLLLNLILNAIQATEKGKRVYVKVDKVNDKVRITVKDEGCGIPPEDIDKIFIPFFKGKNKKEGTGLGLALVNEIVRRHGGHIKIESSLGKGSTFEVYLPFS